MARYDVSTWKDVNYDDYYGDGFAYQKLQLLVSDDPACRLLDAETRRELVSLIVTKLFERRPRLNQVPAWTCDALEATPISVFGHTFIQHVGNIVQRALYPESLRAQEESRKQLSGRISGIG
jgi:hypothetical protein